MGLYTMCLPLSFILFIINEIFVVGGGFVSGSGVLHLLKRPLRDYTKCIYGYSFGPFFCSVQKWITAQFIWRLGGPHYAFFYCYLFRKLDIFYGKNTLWQNVGFYDIVTTTILYFKISFLCIIKISKCCM